jgi:glucose-6-phosphate 1-dehydrogenase
MAENFGVEDRRGFYDPVGALRDVVQNHLLQLVGLFAAEPPSVNTPDGQRVTHRRWRDYGRSERGT